MQIDKITRHPEQFAQCNFLLTFLDEDHQRFQELRFADKRSRFKIGTIPWFEEDLVFRVPRGTRYVVVSCILGSDGTAWFDNVELSVPRPLNWQTQRTENFVFHWLPERPFPPGSIENEQRLFDYYAGRLGVESNVVVHYYLYPDSAAIREALSLKGVQYVSYDDQEIHVINPNEDHEIIHMITDVYGVPPRSIAEGTVFWLHGNLLGKPINEWAAFLLSKGKLPRLQDLFNYNDFALLSPYQGLPASASFVNFIVDRWGTEKLIELYRRIAGFNSYDLVAGAFEKVYEVPLPEAERQWRVVLSTIDVDESIFTDVEQ
jgi:hypothetical protein